MWLIPPSLSGSCPSSPASEAWSLDSDSLCRTLERCAWSRGRPRRLHYWRRRSVRARLTPALSGWTTWSASRLPPGVVGSIGSPAPIPASPTPPPDGSADATTSDGSSTTCFALSASAGLSVSSARTWRGTPRDSSRPSSLHWNEWAIALRRECSARRKWGRHTTASDFSSWATPTASDANGGVRYHGYRHAPWLALSGQALLWWAISHPFHCIRGLPSGVALNPPFVEALMGFPTGWTEYGRSAMPSCPWWSQMRSWLCTVVSVRTEPEPGRLL